MELEERILPALPVEVGPFHLNYVTVFTSSLAVVMVALLAWLLARRLGKYPGRRQLIAELVVGAFEGIVRQVMGRRYGRLFLPLFGTLFLYIFMSNMMGLVPVSALTWGAFPEKGLEISSEPILVDLNDNALWDPGEPFEDGNGNGIRDAFYVAPFEEPTKDINMTLGVALWLAAIMYLTTLYFRGPLHLAKDLVDPLWFMLPLNLIGKVAEVISVSFRLFGNIFGGTVIIVVLWDLVWSLFPLPAAMVANFPLWAVMVLFLTLLVGTVQAFVYTMLWITYTTTTLGSGEE